jgi:hypothetical protein
MTIPQDLMQVNHTTISTTDELILRLRGMSWRCMLLSRAEQNPANRDQLVRLGKAYLVASDRIEQRFKSGRQL